MTEQSGADELIGILSAELGEARKKLAKVYVTQAAEGEDDSPERILFEAGARSPKEMLDAYKKKMDAYDTIPLDIEGDVLRLYRGQWTIWSGYTGTGKTTNIRQSVCHLLKAKKSVFVATLEQDPEDYVIELAACAAGVEMVNERQLESFIDTYGERLHVWGIIGVADHKKILATVRYLAEKGLDYAVLDSLMMLDVDTGDFEGQRQFAALLTATALAKQIHIILVAHPKKPMDPDASPSTNDVAGSSNLGNLAYNVLFVRRGPTQPGNDGKVTPMELHILKQRTRGRLGVLRGFFYREQNQFHLGPDSPEPTHYLPDKMYPASGLTDDIPEHILNPNAFRVVPESTDSRPVWEL